MDKIQSSVFRLSDTIRITAAAIVLICLGTATALGGGETRTIRENATATVAAGLADKYICEAGCTVGHYRVIGATTAVAADAFVNPNETCTATGSADCKPSVTLSNTSKTGHGAQFNVTCGCS